METLLDARELATRLGVSVETVRWWRKCKTGPRAVKVGRRVLYAESDVAAWLQSRREQVPA
ncbi:helix-turn-helix domain-containing protein [Janibacter melonis]|uniref:helix-turn-helix transcriptional regulator n=1 Tax=Janibacter melonis TaxID=262209 RepID=UPI001780ECB3|nr:DNA-binding protein [Janibacter melonis]